MMPVIKCEHQVVGAEWDEVEGLWRLKVKDLKTGGVFDDECHFLLDGCGILK